jgi:type I restriction enzyme S subunit
MKKRITQIRHGQVPKGYMKTVFGVVPDAWHKLRIDEICRLSSGSTPRRDNAGNFNGNILWVTSGELKAKFVRDTKEKVSQLATKESRLELYEPGTVVVAIYGLEAAGIRGTASIIEKRCTISQACMAFSDFKGVDNEFFYYWYLHNGSFIGTRFAQGTKQQNLSSEIIGSLLINLPSLAEQRKIAKILAAQDKVIELKEKRLAEKQRQKKYLAKQMFSGMKCVLPLSELALITMGQSPSSETYNTSFNGVPLIQGNADISNRKTFPRMYTTSPTKICSPGDILISVRAPVGTVARSTISACIGRGICSIRPKRMSDYIYEYLLYYEDKWGRVSQGSTFESISGDDIGKLSIPQHHESDQVAKMLTFAGKEIDLLSQDIEQEKRKKKALMQLLLTGIVRVNV